jgi:hypothetical protein
MISWPHRLPSSVLRFIERRTLLLPFAIRLEAHVELWRRDVEADEEPHGVAAGAHFKVARCAVCPALDVQLQLIADEKDGKIHVA